MHHLHLCWEMGRETTRSSWSRDCTGQGAGSWLLCAPSSHRRHRRSLSGPLLKAWLSLSAWVWVCYLYTQALPDPWNKIFLQRKVQKNIVKRSFLFQTLKTKLCLCPWPSFNRVVSKDESIPLFVKQNSLISLSFRSCTKALQVRDVAG